MNTRTKLQMGLYLIAIVLLAACGGGGGGGGGDSGGSGAANLVGTWLGSYHSSNYSNYATLTVSADSANRITSLKHNTVTLPYTGSITHLNDLLYRFDLDNSGGSGGFLIDASATYAGFLNIENGDFGVVQRNATALATSYSLSDLAGLWSGYSVALNDTGTVTTYAVSSAIVDNNGNVSDGQGPFGQFVGIISLSNSGLGVYSGTYVNSTKGISGNLRLYLSPDKQFAASWACDEFAAPHVSTSCSYNSWNKRATTPTAPSNLNVSNIGRTGATLTWSDTTNETGYQIGTCSLVSVGSNGSLRCVGTFTELAAVGANVTSYTFTTLSANTIYTLFVRAFNAAGNSTPSLGRGFTTLP